jgi:hypothetical protein
VPELLVTGRLVVLPHGRAVTLVSALQCERSPAHGSQKWNCKRLGQLVEVLDVLQRDDDDVAFVVDPPLRGDERERFRCALYLVARGDEIVVDPARVAAERAVVVRGCMAVHVARLKPALTSRHLPV